MIGNHAIEMFDRKQIIMTEKSCHSPPGDLCAGAILKAFAEYQSKFRVITQRAKARFQDRDWHGMKADAAERLELYKEAVDRIVAEISRLLGNRSDDKEIWMSAKAVYSGLSGRLDVWELSETFFNSVTRRIFATVGVDPRIEFVDTCSRFRPLKLSQVPYRTYAGARSSAILMETILGDYEHQTAYEDQAA